MLSSIQFCGNFDIPKTYHSWASAHVPLSSKFIIPMTPIAKLKPAHFSKILKQDTSS